MFGFIDSLSKTKKNLLLGGFLIGALALTVIVSQKQTSYKQRASEIVSPPTTTGNISLAATTPKTQLTLNEQTDLDIYLEAGNQNVTGVSFALSSSNVSGNIGIGLSIPSSAPVVFTAVSPSYMFNNLLKGTTFYPEYYEYAAVDTIGNVATGRVKLGTITIMAKNTGTADVRFYNVQATGLGIDGLLGNQQNVNIQFTVSATASPTVVPPTATPTPGLIGSCRILYDKIIAAFDSTNACGSKYDPAADLNKDRFVNGLDYSIFLRDSANGTNQVACTNYLNNTTNPCTVSPTPTIPGATNTPPPPTATPTGPVPGDANGDKKVDIIDYQIWRDEYLGNVATKQADFNKDGKIDLIDFSIFRNAFKPGVG